MKKFYGYCRISVKDQSKNSIELQLRVLKKYAEQKGMLFEGYTEKWSGKSKDDRKILNEVLSKLQEGDVFAVYDDSRLGRNTTDTLEIARQIKNKKAIFCIGDEEIDIDNPDHEYRLTVDSAHSTKERKRQRQKSLAGMEISKENGTWIFTSRLYGYKVTMANGKPVVSIIETEAEVLKFIFTEYAKGCSIRDITNRLNKKGLRTREGEKFHTATVRRYILKPIYKGYYLLKGAGLKKGQEQAEYKEENLVKSKYYPAIISEELWDTVNKSYRTVTRTHSRQFKYRWSYYELTGILRCYHCKQLGKDTGYVHSFSKVHDKVNENYTNRVHLEGCKQTFHTFRADILEHLFEQCFFLLFMNELEFSDYIEEKRKVQDEDDIRLKNDIGQLEEFLGKIGTKRKNLIDAIANGAKQEHIIPELNKLDDEEQEFKTTIRDYEAILNSKNTDIEDVADDFKENMLGRFISLQPQHRREVLSRMIKSAWVFNSQIVIRFRNSKLYIIPLEKNRGRIVQTVFNIKTYFRNRYQYTFQYDYNADELILTDVPYNKKAWADMPEILPGYIGDHEDRLKLLKAEIKRAKGK